MEDEKLKECWVVLTDCINSPTWKQHIVPLKKAEAPDDDGIRSVRFLKEEIESSPPEDANVPNLAGGVVPNFDTNRKYTASFLENPLAKTSAHGGQITNIKPHLTKLKWPGTFWKSARKRRRAFLTTATRAKQQLLVKSGRSLLQKPSLSINNIPPSSPVQIFCEREGYFLPPKNNSIIDVFTTDANPEINKVISTTDQNIDVQKLESVESSVKPTSCVLREDLIIDTKKECTSDTLSSAGSLITNPSCPMPSVGLTLDVGVGCPLQPLQAKCVLTCLEGCNNSLTSEYAELCTAVVQTSSQLSTGRVILPIKDKEVLQLMQMKWNAKSAVKKITVADHLRASNLRILPRRLCPKTSPLSSSTVELNMKQIKVTSLGTRGSLKVNPSCKSEKLVQNCENPIYLKRSHCGHPFGIKQENHFPKTETVTKTCTDMDQSAHPTDLLSSKVLETSNSVDATCEGDSIPRKHTKLSLLAGDKLITPEVINIDDDDDEINCSIAENSAKVNCDRNSMIVNVKSGRRTIDIDDALRKISERSAFDVPQAKYDPDDTRGVKEFEEVVVAPRGAKRSRSSHLMHELRRLNVAVFDMSTCGEPVVCKLPDICRLGCVCSSLLARVVRDNCGLEICIFGCVCLKAESFRRESETFSWIQNKAKANLAKEERHFKQTVVRSGKDNLIHVEGRRKREIKLPKKYREDFVSSETDFQLFHQMGSKKPKQTSIHGSEMSEEVKDHPRSSKKGKCSPKSLIKENSELNLPSVLRQSKPITANDSCHDTAPPKTGTLVQKSEPFQKNPAKKIVEKPESLQQNCAKQTVMKPSSPTTTNLSARTVFYHYSSREHRQAKRKQLLSDSTCVKVESSSELKIVSTRSLGPEDWEETDNKKYPDTVAETSCSFLFDPEFIKEKQNDVVLLPWIALRNDVSDKKMFVWFKSIKMKQKVLLTDSFIAPSESCVELQSVNDLSNELKNLPFNLRTLRFDYSPTKNDEQFVWIVKHVKSVWMIVGFMQPEKQNPQPICEVDILPIQDADSPRRWWVMDSRQNFDLIYFMDFKKALTKDQINTLVTLSVEDPGDKSKVHRILLNRSRPKIDPTPVPYPDFGAYSLSDHPNDILIGPYDSFKEPRFQVYSQKVALNGKSEYEAIPLFYSGGGECVRVNSRGVLSLCSETLPKKCVLGSWYQGCGNDPRASSEKGHLVQPNLPSVDAADSSPVSPKGLKDIIISSPEPHSISDSENEIVEMVQTEPLSSERLVTLTEDTNNAVSATRKDINKKEKTVFVSFDKSQSKGISHVSPKSAPISLSNKQDIVPVNSLPEKDSGRLKPNCTSNSSNSGTSKRSLENANVTVAEESTELVMEYLIPSVRDIGVLSLTYLPSGTISTVHFTEPGLLKFYHKKEEIIQEINKLIHQKLACLSMKCSVFLKLNNQCKCVSWKSISDKLGCMQLPQFSPDIFNGYFMLTEYGLLDLRSADEGIISKLGQDWIEWLKNDEIRLKLCQWKLKEDAEVSEKQQELMKVLTLGQGSNLSLPQVLSMATDEIAKLKAKNQLLNHESQTQDLMKETLILSMCQKLNGIPGHVVPKFLEHLELNLLWEVLECMDNRNTSLLPEERPATKGFKRTATPTQSGVEKRWFKPPELSPVDKGTIPTISEEEADPHTRAILYRRRLLEECRRDELQQQLRKQRNQAQIRRMSAEETNVQFSPEGIVCRVLPFSRLNICVEEGGIKYAPLSSPPRPVSPVQDSTSELPVSPGKPPNILRKSKSHPADIPLPGVVASSSVISAQKQARKQIFFCDNDEEPVFLDSDCEDDSSNQSLSGQSSKTSEGSEDGEKVESGLVWPSPPPTVSTTREPESAPLLPSTDPIFSLRIASVVSGAENVTPLMTAETGVSPPLTNTKNRPHSSSVPGIEASIPPSLSTATKIAASTSNSSINPIDSLRISSVFSAQKISAAFSATEAASPHIVSEAMPSISASDPTSVSLKTSAPSNRGHADLSSNLSQPCASSTVPSVSPFRNSSSGFLSRVFLKPAMIRTLVKTDHSSPRVLGPRPRVNSLKPFYVLSGKNGKLIRTETLPSSASQGASDSKSILKASGFNVTVPLSALKILKPGNLSNLVGPQRRLSSASSTKLKSPDPRIPNSNPDLSSAKSDK